MQKTVKNSLSDLDYSYPEHLVALKPRFEFKAYFTDLKTKEDKIFHKKESLFEMFHQGDILAYNESYVLPRKMISLEGVEVVFVKEIQENLWHVLYPSKKKKVLHFKTHKS